MNSISPFNKKIRLVDSLHTKLQTNTSLYFIRTLKNYLNIRKKEISSEDALNAIIYGINCMKIKQGKAKNIQIFQIDTRPQIISLADKNEEQVEEIDITNIIAVSFDMNNENINSFKVNTPLIPIEPHSYIQILINKMIYDFIFDNENDLCLFIAGIIHLYENMIDFGFTNMENNIKKIWQFYDKDFSGKMEPNEFKIFCEDLNFQIGQNQMIKQFKKIDKDKSGTIEFNEFLNFFKSYTNGSEYKKIFDEYDIDIKTKKHTGKISPDNLKLFFEEVQKDNLSLNEVNEIILIFKQNLKPHEKEQYIRILQNGDILNSNVIDNYLYLNSGEFLLLLHSPIVNVLDYVKMNTSQNMNRPLNDYFINSTHNTYLTGHQLSGESSPQMYAFSVLEGYRLVELDCYNGNGDDIIITHGYTMVTDIHLNDILIELKENAFIHSKYPVLLSIENHLDEEHQKIMAKSFKTILKDIYILDQDNPPDYLPSVKDMKGKFVIKCGGKRVLKDRTKITPRKDLKYENENDSLMKSDMIVMNVNEKEEEIVNSTLIMNSRRRETRVHLNPKNVDMKKYKEAKKNTETGNELSHVRGLFGTKFHQKEIKKTNYQPWEMVTLKSTKVLSFSKDYDTRKDIIEFTQNSLMKAYPQSFDSSNYDPIKCWIMGVQVAALNIQSLEDDYTLMNMIFFKQNRNCGYVLKPKKLLPESTFYESYSHPIGKIRFDLISTICVHKLIQKEGLPINKDSKLRLEVFIVGSNEDDENNKKYSIDLPGNYFHHNIKCDPLVFNIYENELSCIFFKLYYEKDVIGRSAIPLSLMKEGYRNIVFYDNYCVESIESFLLARISSNLPKSK